MKQMPQVQKVMTTMPHTVGKDVSIKTALGLMREYNIRHLPVQDAGKLVGILTDRDLKLASSFKGSEDLKVEEVMTPDPYTVAPDSALNDVVMRMAEKKFGAVIVQQTNGKVVGIFTAVDAMREFAETLMEHYKK